MQQHSLYRLTSILVVIAAYVVTAPVSMVEVSAQQLDQMAGERIIRQLGGSTRFSAPVRTVDELMSMATNNRGDLEQVLGIAGLSFISSQVMDALTSGNVERGEFLPGEHLEWMALRRGGRLELIYDARWGGNDAFDGFRFTIESDTASYHFIVPVVCGNLALINVDPREPAPVAKIEDSTPIIERTYDWYVGADIGYVHISDGSYDFIGAATIPHSAEFDGGLSYSMQVGRSFDALRLELEFARRKNDADKFGSVANVGNGKGSIKSTSLMLNGFYDFRLGERLVPYLGIGLGGTDIKSNRVRKSVAFPSRTGTLFDDDNRFTWQILAGAAYELNKRWMVKLDYRYIDAGDVDFKYGVGCAPDGRDCIFTDALDESYAPHIVSAGLRYLF